MAIDARIYKLIILLITITSLVLNILFVYYPVLIIQTEIKVASDNVQDTIKDVDQIITEYGPIVDNIISETISIETKISKILESINTTDLGEIQNIIEDVLTKTSSSNINSIYNEVVTIAFTEKFINETSSQLSTISGPILDGTNLTNLPNSSNQTPNTQFNQIPLNQMPINQMPINQMPINQMPINQMPVSKVSFKQECASNCFGRNVGKRQCFQN